MSFLDKWLPFKFKKKTSEEKKQESKQSLPARHASSQPVPATGEAPLGSLFSPQMQQLMQGFFNDPFFRDPFGGFGQLDRWFGDFSPNRFSPSIEVSDEEKALKVTAELPGMDKDDVKLQLDGDRLVISGEKKSESESEEEGVFRTERYFGHFHRAIPLPKDVDHEHAEAEFKKGVLTIRFPKLASSPDQSRRIEIRG